MEFKDYVPTRVLHDFVGRIEKLGIAYMLTGSMAMIRYTVFWQTADVDIILALDFNDREKLIDALEPVYYVPHQAVSRAVETCGMFNVIHQETAFKVDCVLPRPDEFQKNSFARREKTDYYGREIWVIGKDDLIISKLWWARDSHLEMQLRDVKNLMRAGFDAEYVEKWTNKIGVSELFLQFRRKIEE